ncbi:hypothetical protein PTKIN_Ptkin03bG0243100 [Pterospermum kingtungense]
MYFQSNGRNQRPRGFNVKLAFQFTLGLAVCIWLLYQIKHLISNDGKDAGSLQAKISERSSVVILGRKGDVELSDKSMYMSDSNDVIVEAEGKQNDGGGGDDELDGNVEYIHGDVKTDAGKVKKMEPAKPDNQSSNSEKTEIEMGDMDKEVSSEDSSYGVENSKRNASNLDKGDEKDLERHTEELHKDENGETGSVKENGEDKDLKEIITKQGNGTENDTVLGLSEVANGVHGFHDENGVPQGGNDLVVGFTLTKSRDGQVNQETISDLNHPSKITKSSQIEEAASKSEKNTTGTETQTQSKQQGSKSDAVLGMGTNSESSSQIQK